MGTMVHVILSGIVSLVPQSDGSYLVRMQDTRQVTQHERHFPSILAESKLVRTNPETDPEAKKPPVDPLYSAWLIANGTLQIQGAPTQGPVTHAELRDVLTIADACPGDRKCAIMKRAFDGVELVVKGGELKTEGREPYRWRFSNEQPSNARRPAEEITWTFEIAAPSLQMSVPVLLRNGQTRSVEFTVQAPPNEDIEIRLQNAPQPDLIPLPENPPPDRDPHVPLYFLLSTNPPNPPVELLRDTETPPQRDPPSRRLSGRKIVETLPHPPAGTGGVGAATAHTQPDQAERAEDILLQRHVVRVNCPPSLWDSLEP